MFWNRARNSSIQAAHHGLWVHAGRNCHFSLSSAPHRLLLTDACLQFSNTVTWAKQSCTCWLRNKSFSHSENYSKCQQSMTINSRPTHSSFGRRGDHGGKFHYPQLGSMAWQNDSGWVGVGCPKLQTLGSHINMCGMEWFKAPFPFFSPHVWPTRQAILNAHRIIFKI